VYKSVSPLSFVSARGKSESLTFYILKNFFSLQSSRLAGRSNTKGGIINNLHVDFSLFSVVLNEILEPETESPPWVGAWVGPLVEFLKLTFKVLAVKLIPSLLQVARQLRVSAWVWPAHKPIVQVHIAGQLDPRVETDKCKLTDRNIDVNFSCVVSGNPVEIGLTLGGKSYSKTQCKVNE